MAAIEIFKQNLCDHLIEVGLDPSFISIEKPKNLAHGDLALPVFKYAASLKKPPVQVSEELSNELKKNLPEGFSEVNQIGPFLNFRIDRASFAKAVLNSKENFDQTQKKVLIDYSSPNIAKPFHVGHLRATLLGHALENIYKFFGYEVVTVNHLGDYGTQFGFVYAGCKIWGEPERFSVEGLVDLYRKATTLKANQESNTLTDEEKVLPDCNQIARSYFVDLENGVSYAKDFWQRCLDSSLEYFKASYKRLGIEFDHYLGESFYSDKLPGVIANLRTSGILTESNGALGIDFAKEPETEQLGFARIATEDGRSLYLTRDIATAIYRDDRFKPEKSLYVVGAPQTLHFNQLVGIFKKLGSDLADRITHVPFGIVQGMKTRGSGEFIELNSLLDESHARALAAYQELVGDKKSEEVIPTNEVDKIADSVGKAALIFNLLSKARNKDVSFSWDEALQFSGDTGPYILYAVARIESVKNRANESFNLQNIEIDYSNFTDDSSFQLLTELDRFSSVINTCIADNDPYYLANYALDLSKTFSAAYNKLRVMGEAENVAASRIALFSKVQIILTQSLQLLGIEAVKRM